MTDPYPPDERSPDGRSESRGTHDEIGARLAEQAPEALNELLRGFALADAEAGGDLLRVAVATDPQHIYGGLITVLLRLVFLLYAEDRALMSGDATFLDQHSVRGLFEELRADAARHPDTMDQRHGAWARLITLFRRVYEGDAALNLPARRGALFDPQRHPFLEGHPGRQGAREDAPIRVPAVPDGVVWRVLEKLTTLRIGEDVERVDFRALDVERIGSIYEAMMGFELRRARAPSLALRPRGVVVDLRELRDSHDRLRLLDQADCRLTGKALALLRAARSVEELAAALDRRAVETRIIPEGALYLQPGEERRRSGSHYTPRGLTEPLVRATLRPVLEALGQRPRPEQILALKACDPAMGGGAFLIEACRQLGLALVAAFDLHGWALDGQQVVVPPDEIRERCAMRLVARRCLYGVDSNPFAVCLARLSLWLVTQARADPFTFLDHALRHGDSLVGLTRRQIARFDWQPDDQGTSPPIAQSTRWTNRAPTSREEATEAARVAGDLCVAAFFGADSRRAREKLRRVHFALLSRWRAGEPAAAAEVARLREGMRTADRPLVPFHWELEFPDVFERENPGFDAVVGNPPFLGGKRISTVLGDTFQSWCQAQMPQLNGNTDLVAIFFRRAFQHLRSRGTMGLIATNTIAQGDTRRSGLTWLCANGAVIVEASRRVPWPGAATVVVSTVAITRSHTTSRCVLDGRPVDRISAFLLGRGTDDEPVALKANANLCFNGCDIKGQGFLFDDGDPGATPTRTMGQILAARPDLARFVKPYIGGEDINGSPTHHLGRFVIDFGDMSLKEAQASGPLLDIVRARVLPDRRTRPGPVATWPWWQFWRTRGELRAAVSRRHLATVFACSLVTTHWALARVSTAAICSHKTAVFVEDRLAFFAVLTSRVHEAWTVFLSSTLGDALNYAPADCFETFPFPHDWTNDPRLEAVGQRFHDHRAALMIRNDEGLTKTCNRLHDPDETDPDVLELRRLHAELDRAVLDAYGWTDIPADCVWRLDHEEPEDEDEDEEPARKHKRKKPWRWRWPEAVHDEVLARLLALNQRRAEEERAAAAPASEGGKKPAISGPW